jgi:hypothetical protein
VFLSPLKRSRERARNDQRSSQKLVNITANFAWLLGYLEALIGAVKADNVMAGELSTENRLTCKS